MEAIHLLKYKGARALLQTLLNFPRRTFTINELAREAKVPFASAWRLVRLWETAGIILTGRVGKSVTVTLRKSEYVSSLASFLQESKSPQAFSVVFLKQKVSRQPQVKQAYLFGSVAKGVEKPSSDIDLALLAGGSYNANELVFGLYEKYGTKAVPLTFKTKAELSSFLKGKTAVRLK